MVNLQDDIYQQRSDGVHQCTQEFLETAVRTSFHVYHPLWSTPSHTSLYRWSFFGLISTRGGSLFSLSLALLDDIRIVHAFQRFVMNVEHLALSLAAVPST